MPPERVPRDPSVDDYRRVTSIPDVAFVFPIHVPDHEAALAALGHDMTHPDSERLIGLLPHRPPFRFVDEVRELTPGGQGDITAVYRVTGEEAFLAGHFPGNPVFPGVLQIEALAQAGAIVLLCLEQYAGKLPLFGGMEKVRFRRVVRPGDELVLEMKIEKLSARGGWATGRATVDGDTTCEARLLFAVA